MCHLKVFNLTSSHQQKILLLWLFYERRRQFTTVNNWNEWPKVYRYNVELSNNNQNNSGSKDQKENSGEKDVKMSDNQNDG